MSKRYVLGICLSNRVESASEFQKILTECGCYIKTRLGLHEVSENLCAPGGLILLEVYGGDAAVAEMESRLKAVKGLQVQKMEFEM
ncbi:MAG: hypothetical protein KA801_10645 [Syntrophorhabdaceae bacterium]|nr:hypothetical protein [Syntrophorhabdaceae bacterium]HBL24944.1 hypothetical protein [Deltaproteobacteria bacterium]